MVLRLRVIMVFIQSGISLLPCLFRSLSFRIWCICTFSLAPQTSHVSLHNRVHHDLGYTVSSAKGGTAHVTLSRYFNPYDRPVRFDEFDRGRVWGAGAPLW